MEALSHRVSRGHCGHSGDPGKGCGKEGCSVNTRIRPGQGWRVWTQPGFSVLKGLGENANLGVWCWIPS